MKGKTALGGIQLQCVSDRIVAQIVMIFHPGREKKRHYYHTSSQKSTLVSDERIVTNTNVHVFTRRQAYQTGDSCRDIRIRSRSNREVSLI